METEGLFAPHKDSIKDLIETHHIKVHNKSEQRMVAEALLGYGYNLHRAFNDDIEQFLEVKTNFPEYVMVRDVGDEFVIDGCKELVAPYITAEDFFKIKYK